MKKEITTADIIKKLKWYHGEEFTIDILTDDFIKKLKNGQYNLN